MNKLKGIKMRVILFVIILLLGTSYSSFSQRVVELFNFDWKFKQGDIRANNPASIDSSWKVVNLPHDASIAESFSKEKSNGANGWLPQQIGWYRKHFKVNSDAKDKLIYIEFEGIYRAAEVWINGNYLGKHLNGYIGFENELTPFLNIDGDNVISVKYNNSKPGTSRWYTGEGIYRNVWLKTLNPIHIPLYGTYVTTPKITSESAIIKVSTKVSNFSSQRKICRLVSEIVDKNGKKVAGFTSVSQVSSHETFSFDQNIELSKPILWSTENPYMYKVISKVFTGNELVDVYETPLGVREIRMTPDRGLLINGKKVVAVGGDLHHDLGCLGSAAFERGYEKRLQALKAMGCNSIRLSHNPHANVLLDLCDKMGILVISEVYDKWTSQFYGGEASFENSWRDDVTAWIERDRNHPSIYIWSVGNEVLDQLGIFDEKFETPTVADKYGVDKFINLKGLVNQLDPTREVTCALFPAREKAVTEWENPKIYYNSLPAELAWYMDVVSNNYMENMIKKDHKAYPQMKFLASEVGTNLGFNYRDLSWLEIDTTFLIGHYYWSACYYLGEATWPAKGWDRAFYDSGEQLTPIGSIYQSFYSQKPMVHLWVFDQKEETLNNWNKMYDNKRWSWYPMHKNWNIENVQNVKLATYTNCEEIELFLNGKLIGHKTINSLKDHLAEWEIPYSTGVVKAVGKVKNKIVAEQELKTAGAPYQIVLEPDRQTIHSDGLDLSYITIRIIDKNGITVPGADRLINFKITGPGEIAGVTNSNNNSDEKWKTVRRSTFNGQCTLIVRSERKEGKIFVIASGEGLPDSSCQIVTSKTNTL